LKIYPVKPALLSHLCRSFIISMIFFGFQPDSYSFRDSQKVISDYLFQNVTVQFESEGD
jgi:hypothetical protein